MHSRLFVAASFHWSRHSPFPNHDVISRLWEGHSFTMSHQNQTALGESAQNSDRGLKKRSVVSSFIFKLEGTSDGQPKVALFRRSDKVSTYRSAAPFPLNKNDVD